MIFSYSSQAQETRLKGLINKSTKILKENVQLGLGYIMNRINSVIVLLH